MNVHGTHYRVVDSGLRPFSNVNLSEIAKSAVSNLQNHITEIEEKIKVGSLPVIEADAGQMYQLFQHLLSFELILHNKKNPLNLAVAGTIVKNKTGQSSKSSPKTKLCQITLEDNGSGIDEERLGNLFTNSYFLPKLDGHL